LTDKSSHSAFWSHLEDALEARQAESLNRKCTVAEPLGPTTISRNGMTLVNFGANDYLGLAWHPTVRQAASDASDRLQKFGSGASPLVTGQTQQHANLHQTIAEFKHCEDAIVFSSGYAANLGTVASLAGKNDIIFSDSLNHASLIDGCRLSRAEVVVYPHGDAVALREIVRHNRHRGRFGFIATDSVFSMDGDLAPLAEINRLCDEFDLQCILDEAHATGVYGENGQGLAEHLGIVSNRIISVGTLSKALGCVGGFVAGPKVLIEWLTNFARSWVYSTAATIPNAAAACKAISIAQSMRPERIELASQATKLRSVLNHHGFRVGIGESPIIPVYINDPKQVLMASERLLQMGVYVPAIRPPTVPRNGSLLRISLSVCHTERDIDLLTNAFASW
jgi:8-amino-7-oxononanoate synthase